MSQKVLVLGATGAVGGEALKALLARPGVEVTVLSRRKLDLEHPALTQHVVDVLDPTSYKAILPGHQAALCALGVGQPSKMSREEFLRVDRDAVLAFGQACKSAGIPHFSLLSAVGSDAKSSFFYPRTKGQLEDGLRAMSFDSLSLFQPSMILTPTNRYGLMQGITLVVWPWLDTILLGGLKKFRGVKVEDLGSAMAADALEHPLGARTLSWDDFQSLKQL